MTTTTMTLGPPSYDPDENHRVIHALWNRLLPTLTELEQLELGIALFRGGPHNLRVVRNETLERAAHLAETIVGVTPQVTAAIIAQEIRDLKEKDE